MSAKEDTETEPEEEAAKAAEPEKPKSEEAEEAEEKEEIVEERIYTIPLREVYDAPPYTRAPKAARLVRAFITRHMKPEEVLIGDDVNEKVWSRGIRNPPRRVRVKASKNKDGVVKVSLVTED
jgi:large subunit ribosomal protein L31e